MIFVYSLTFAAVLVLSAPVWGWRMARQGRYREGLRERLGAVPSRLTANARGRPVIWLHAVSVGETLAATHLVYELKTALPGYSVVVSTTTPTGQRVARERFGVDTTFFYPLDFAFAVRSYLRAVKPKLVVLMESELWPRMIVECARHGIPVAVVNARVSDRSLPRYMALRSLWRPLLQRVSLLLAQSDEDARRWKQIGVPAQRVHSTGNLKFDVQSAEETPLTALLRNHMPRAAKVLVCGSTHEDEESLLLDCWRDIGMDGTVLILAPRHPERVAYVEQLAHTLALVTERLSQWRLAPAPIAAGAVLLVDSVGELASLYSLATVAFIGGSLVKLGGQNPLEAARFGVPLVMGPSYENFHDVVDGLVQAGGLKVVTETTLCASLRSHLTGIPNSAMGQNARTYFGSQSGATARTVAALRSLLKASQ